MKSVNLNVLIHAQYRKINQDIEALTLWTRFLAGTCNEQRDSCFLRKYLYQLSVIDFMPKWWLIKGINSLGDHC